MCARKAAREAAAFEPAWQRAHSHSSARKQRKPAREVGGATAPNRLLLLLTPVLVLLRKGRLRIPHERETTTSHTLIGAGKLAPDGPTTSSAVHGEGHAGSDSVASEAC